MRPCMAWMQLFKRMRVFEYGGYTPQRGEVSARFCALAPGACVRYLFLLCGANPHENLERRLLPLIMQWYPSGTSARNMEHWGQVRRCSSWLPRLRAEPCMHAQPKPHSAVVISSCVHTHLHLFKHPLRTHGMSQGSLRSAEACSPSTGIDAHPHHAARCCTVLYCPCRLCAGGRHARSGALTTAASAQTQRARSWHATSACTRRTTARARATQGRTCLSRLPTTSPTLQRRWRSSPVRDTPSMQLAASSLHSACQGAYMPASTRAGCLQDALIKLFHTSGPWMAAPPYSLRQAWGKCGADTTTLTVVSAAGQDSLSTPQDVAELIKVLGPRVVREHHHVPHYAHLDYGMGVDAAERVWPQLLRFLAGKHAPGDDASMQPRSAAGPGMAGVAASRMQRAPHADDGVSAPAAVEEAPCTAPALHAGAQAAVRMRAQCARTKPA